MPQLWRFMHSGRGEPGLNMALDEALLLTHEAAGGPPILRVYGWQTPTLSLGYAQNVAREVAVDACQAHGVSIVRRPTGGRAVLHHHEVTYSVIMPTALDGEALSLSEHYRRIGLALQQAFQSLGLPVHLARPPARAIPPRTPVSPACFAALSRYELSVEGGKLVGSAQKRLRQALLQHGSIPLWLDRQRLFACLQVPSSQRQRLVQEAYTTMAAVNEVAPAPVTCAMLHAALRDGFATAFEAEFQDSVPSGEEWQLTQHMLLTKYATPAWNLGGGAAWRQSQEMQGVGGAVLPQESRTQHARIV